MGRLGHRLPDDHRLSARHAGDRVGLRPEGLEHPGRVRGRRPEPRVPAPLLHHGRLHLQRLRLPGRSRLGVLARRRGVSTSCPTGRWGSCPGTFLGPRIAMLGRRFGFVTQAEFFAYRFESTKAIPAIMAVMSAAALVPYLVIQMKGAGYVFSVVTEGRMPEWAGAALAYGVVLIYVARSGVMGVGWTNTFQGILMLGLAWGARALSPLEAPRRHRSDVRGAGRHRARIAGGAGTRRPRANHGGSGPIRAPCSSRCSASRSGPTTS